MFWASQRVELFKSGTLQKSLVYLLLVLYLHYKN